MAGTDKRDIDWEGIMFALTMLAIMAAGWLALTVWA